MNNKNLFDPENLKFLVSLRKDDLKGMHFCCGSSLTRLHVLTAACCIEKIKDIKKKNGKVVVAFRKVDLPATMDKAPIRNLIIDPNYPSDFGIILVG